MKLRKYILLAVLVLATAASAATKSSTVSKKVYMFGLAASFNDTIVHFTEIQAIDSAQLTRKHHFLVGRNLYSNMLRDYLQQNNMPYRTCMVFYDKKLSRLQKKFLKLKKLYRGDAKKGVTNNDIRDIAGSDFKFKIVKLADDAVIEEQPAPAPHADAPKKGGKKGPRPPKHPQNDAPKG